MNDVRDRVSELLRLRSFSSHTYEATDECIIKEECDMYGFSLVSQCSNKHGAVRHPRSQTNSILDDLMRDQNWNNPGNVCLMCQAYEIEEAYRSVVFGQLLGDSKSTYLVLKSQQNQMFSDRYYNEGVAFKSRGLWSESVKSLADALVYNADNINARIERADCYFRQNRKTEAYNDYKMVLAVQPNNAVAMERLTLLRNNTNFTPLPPSTGTSVHSSSSSRIQLTDRKNVEYTSTVPSGASSSAHNGIDSLSANKNVHSKPLVYKNTNLIGKLQQALLDNPNYFDTSSSSNSDSSSDSSSDSGDSRSSDRKSSRKRQRREGKGSRKELKAHKKKKSKHKKEKRSKDSKKKKKKHKSEK